jgi:hypothetical protein
MIFLFYCFSIVSSYTTVVLNNKKIKRKMSFVRRNYLLNLQRKKKLLMMMKKKRRMIALRKKQRLNVRNRRRRTTSTAAAVAAVIPLVLKQLIPKESSSSEQILDLTLDYPPFALSSTGEKYTIVKARDLDTFQQYQNQFTESIVSPDCLFILLNHNNHISNSHSHFHILGKQYGILWGKNRQPAIREEETTKGPAIIAAYVVTIRDDRYERFRQTVEPFLPFSVVHKINGVNGSTLHWPHLIRRRTVTRAAQSHLKRGQVGWFLSFQMVWKEILNSTLPFAFVMEDDIGFTGIEMKMKLEYITQVLYENQSQWDLCYISYNIYRGKEDRDNTIQSSFHPSFRRVLGNGWTTTFGFFINRHAASVFHDHFLPITNVAGDVRIGQIANQYRLKRFRLEPRLSGEFDFGSDTSRIR